MSNTTELSTAKAREVASALSGMESGGHEQVVHFFDKATGLKAIVAIHNTHLGPALGGTRMWTYKTEEEALGIIEWYKNFVRRKETKEIKSVEYIDVK
jgi:glutamate dehydrogenase/leucine dehydrogenase